MIQNCNQKSFVEFKSCRELDKNTPTKNENLGLIFYRLKRGVYMMPPCSLSGRPAEVATRTHPTFLGALHRTEEFEGVSSIGIKGKQVDFLGSPERTG